MATRQRPCRSPATRRVVLKPCLLPWSRRFVLVLQPIGCLSAPDHRWKPEPFPSPPDSPTPQTADLPFASHPDLNQGLTPWWKIGGGDCLPWAVVPGEAQPPQPAGRQAAADTLATPQQRLPQKPHRCLPTSMPTCPAGHCHACEATQRSPTLSLPQPVVPWDPHRPNRPPASCRRTSLPLLLRDHQHTREKQP